MNEKEFEYNGVKLKAVPINELKDTCVDCYFHNNGCDDSFIDGLRPSCLDINRKDETNVIFVEVKMEKIKLKDYKKDYICYLDEFENVQIVGTDYFEMIEELVSEGKIFYGTIKEKVFNSPYWDIRDMIKNNIDNMGYEDMEDDIDYNTEEFKNLVSAYEEWIESLGSVNNVYYQDENVIIEVEDESME